MKNEALFERARKLMPGGVNSPVRAFRAVNSSPLFIRQAKGAYITDVEGKTYIDFVCSWGPLILGHTHPEVIETIIKTAEQGTSFGACTEREIQMAELIIKNIPSIEKVRLVNSGTEATMTALRLARAFTKRNKIVKFEGCYHGHADSLLVKAGSGLATFSIPDSGGVTETTAADTLCARYNDLASVQKLFDTYSKDIAGVIVEPVAANMGVVPPEPGFLQGLKEITRKTGSVLIFDEVITGFRLGRGGAQEYFKVIPDLTTLGKIIGGGLPVGAFGGRKEIMDMLAPDGRVYQAGTLSGNPLAMAAGIKTLQLISRPSFYQELNKKSDRFFSEIQKIISRENYPMQLTHITSLGSIFFTSHLGGTVRNFDDASRTDRDRFIKFFGRLIEKGIYIAPSPFEAWFISMAHSGEDLTKTLEVIESALS